MAYIFSEKWVRSSDKRGRKETDGGLRPVVEVWKFCVRNEMGQLTRSQKLLSTGHHSYGGACWQSCVKAVSRVSGC